MLAFMNHFPLFAVMLRLKNPARLPGAFSGINWVRLFLSLTKRTEYCTLLIWAGGIYVILEGTPPQPVVKASPLRLKPGPNWPA